MQQEATASYVGRDDLESPRVPAVDKPSDLVALLVHVSRGGKPPPLTTTSSVNTESAHTQRLQPLAQHQHVEPQADQQHDLHVSQTATTSSTKVSITSSINSSQDNPALDNARLTEPFSPVHPLQDSEFEKRSSRPIDQIRRSSATITTPPKSTPASPNSLNISPLSPKQIGFDSLAAESPRQKGKMFFGELQRSSAAAHRRRSMATTSAITDYEADLTSKDRIKQKDAIKMVLAGKVREDWSWTWPKKDNEPVTPVVNRSRESLVEEDWREREEWISNASGSEDENGAIIGTPNVVDASNGKDPFRFDSPDGVGDTLRKTAEDRKARRRRRLQEEMRVNDGLSCFTHRRNAWTCARHVRRIPRTSSTTTSLKRTLSRPNSKPSPAAPTPPIPTTEDDFLDVITEIRIAPPILPPETPMRKGINERAYATIYDKVVLQSQTPFCPINLSVVTKSCVEGWKRDGEWPPKPGEMEAVISSIKKTGLGPEAEPGRGNRRESESKDGMGGGSKSRNVLRRSLQKVMGAVRERAGSKGKEGEVVLKE